MIGSATYIAWPLAEKMLEDNDLDRIEVANARGQRIIEATGAEQVAAAIAYAKEHVSGEIVVSAWKSTERKASAYVWCIRNREPGAVAGPAPSGNLDLLEKLYDTRLELALLQHERENDNATKFDKIAEVAQTLGPQLIAALTGRPAPQPIARPAAPAQEETEEPGSIPADEMQGMLADVVRYAKANPDQARQYIAMLRAQTPTENA